jgi:hypothetical protein
MRKLGFVAALLLAAACTSSKGQIQPEIEIHDITVPEARTPAARQFSTVLEIEITNPSNVPLTVDRIQVGSVSIGTFSVDSVVERPQRVLAPGETQTFQLWTQMRVVQDTPSDGLDPIFLRGSAEFISPAGAFRRTFAKQVNPSTLQ